MLKVNSQIFTKFEDQRKDQVARDYVLKIRRAFPEESASLTDRELHETLGREYDHALRYGLRNETEFRELIVIDVILGWNWRDDPRHGWIHEQLMQAPHWIPIDPVANVLASILVKDAEQNV